MFGSTHDSNKLDMSEIDRISQISNELQNEVVDVILCKPDGVQMEEITKAMDLTQIGISDMFNASYQRRRNLIKPYADWYYDFDAETYVFFDSDDMICISAYRPEGKEGRRIEDLFLDDN